MRATPNARPWDPGEGDQERQDAQGGDLGVLGDLPPGDVPAGPILLSEVEAEEVTWLWPARIPLGKVTLLEGDPDEGKSCIAVDAAARVTTGSPFPLESEGRPPAGVVYLTAEDGLGDTIRPRLDAAGGDATRVAVFPLEALPTLGDPGGIARIEAAIRRVDAKLVVVDPFMAFVTERVDSYKDHHLRRLLTPLAALAQRTGVAVLAIRHLTKDDKRRAKYRGGGSIGLIGAARSALLAAPDPDDETTKVLAVVKHNLAPLAPALGYRLVSAGAAPRVEWLGPTHHAADDLAGAFDAEERSAFDEAIDFLRTALGTGSRPAREVTNEAQDAGIAPRTLERARRQVCAKPTRDASRWYWTLREGEERQDSQERHEDHLGALGHLPGSSGRERFLL
jgi:hypothetical protein